MHARTKPGPSLYDQLEALPAGTDRRNPRRPALCPAAPEPAAWLHRLVARHDLIGPFQRGRGGPGGWWFIDEPELHFIRDAEVDVPDLAGWRRERMPVLPQGHRALVVPDWVCEVLSPSTAGTDREIKMPIYARFGVAYAWLLDPIAHTLEAYALDTGTWREIGRFAGAALASIAPFDAVTINLGDLWASTE